KLLNTFWGYINQTMHYLAGDMAKIPLVVTSDQNKIKLIDSCVCKNIFLSRNDWDSFETSWDFKKHPLI
ncbi:MAG: hypothetical protein KBT46_08970, partial [Ruminococcus sp.]|nr:hypothetical protein [Candidatus Copronaster equi]